VRRFKQAAVDPTGSARRRIEVGGCVRDVAESLWPVLRGRSVALELVIPARLEADIQPGALSRIVANLLQNALSQAFPDDRAGVVTLAVGPGEDGRGKLSCRDDGVGIPADVVDCVLRPFFTTRLGRGGSGLRRFIVHHLAIDTRHGTVSVTSSCGQGTAFEVVFPTACRDAEHGPSRRPSGAPSRGAAGKDDGAIAPGAGGGGRGGHRGAGPLCSRSAAR
jgi:signal transduction histidine kinase